MSDRNEQIRRRMLNIARLRDEANQGGFVSVRVVATARDDEDRPVDSDTHAQELIDSLIEWGLLEESRDVHSQSGAKREFGHRRVRITGKGWKLWMGEIPPIPGVADSRFGD